MAGSLNKVMVIGHLGRDPELRYTQSGQPVAQLNVATDESYTDREGNRQDRTEWHRVSVWGRQAENCNSYLSKGSLVFVEGSLQTRKWQDQQGQDRYTTEIKAFRVQFLDPKGGGRGGQQSYGPPDEEYGPPQGGGKGGGQRKPPQQQGGGQNNQDDDMGPAFPSEASGMDDVPF